MKNYFKQNIEAGIYGKGESSGAYSHASIRDWTDYFVHDDMLFSHRVNNYTCESFSEGLRRNDYYEVVVYVSGNVEYVRENDVIIPEPGMIIACPPGEMHTARLLKDGGYERYVFYFNRDFFTYCGESYPLPGFIEDPNGHGVLLPDGEKQKCIFGLLALIEEALSKNNVAGRALAHSYIVGFFSLLGGKTESFKNAKLPENVARIKKYIDTYYNSIEGVNEIASYFFYSREHASRLFKQYFNITLTEYLAQRRIASSAKLLLEGNSVTDACYEVGFRSVSSFINAFRRVTGYLPSEYKKKKE